MREAFCLEYFLFRKDVTPARPRFFKVKHKLKRVYEKSHKKVHHNHADCIN